MIAGNARVQGSVHQAAAFDVARIALGFVVMTEYADEETQWTTSARAAYIVAVEAASVALAAHAERVQARQGRETELMPYFNSAGTLQGALDQLREAEFDLCGSFPFSPVGFDDDDDEAVGGWLTVEFAAHYGIADEEKLIQAGRDAYLSAWPDQTPEDAEGRVTSPSVAISELLHTVGLAALDTDNDYPVTQAQDVIDGVSGAGAAWPGDLTPVTVAGQHEQPDGSPSCR
jgi:hypothetical protein